MNANYTYGRLMDNQFGESNTYSARSQNALTRMISRSRVKSTCCLMCPTVLT